jgi:hypothetical protein
MITCICLESERHFQHYFSYIVAVTYLEVIDDADITNKHSDHYEMVD